MGTPSWFDRDATRRSTTSPIKGRLARQRQLKTIIGRHRLKLGPLEQIGSPARQGQPKTKSHTNLLREHAALLGQHVGDIACDVTVDTTGVAGQNAETEEYPIGMVEPGDRHAQHSQKGVLAAVARMLGPRNVAQLAESANETRISRLQVREQRL